MVNNNPITKSPVKCPECSGLGEVTIAGCSGTKNIECPACKGVRKMPEPLEQQNQTLAEFSKWLNGECTCRMCPKDIAFAYHETAPNKWYVGSYLCLHHQTHGNEGMFYVPVREAVKMLYITKIQLQKVQTLLDAKDEEIKRIKDAY